MNDALYFNGRYGIVDPFYRHIWLNTYDEELAHKIRKVFQSKVSTVVFDLTQFKNYSDTAIDSDVCLDWKISPSPYSSPLVGGNHGNPDFEKTQTTHTSDFLVNEPNHSHLPITLQKDLQKQMMIYHRLYSRISPFKIFSRIDKNLLTDVDKIFQENLQVTDIKKTLYHFANTISEPSFSLAWTILCEIESLYE